MDKKTFLQIERLVHKALATNGFYYFWQVPPGRTLHDRGIKELYFERAAYLCAPQTVSMSYADSEEYMGHRNLHFASQYLFKANALIVMPKFAPWSRDVNMYTIRLHEMGFNLYYEIEMLPLWARQTISLAKKQDDQTQLNPLQMQHFYMPLWLLGAGITPSLISFIVELLFKPKKPKKIKFYYK